MNQNLKNTQKLAFGGMLAALVFAATYLFKIPISITQGYIHLGDAFILLGAVLLDWTAVPAAGHRQPAGRPDRRLSPVLPAYVPHQGGRCGHCRSGLPQDSVRLAAHPLVRAGGAVDGAGLFSRRVAPAGLRSGRGAGRCGPQPGAGSQRRSDRCRAAAGGSPHPQAEMISFRLRLSLGRFLFAFPPQLWYTDPCHSGKCPPFGGSSRRKRTS